MSIKLKSKIKKKYLIKEIVIKDNEIKIIIKIKVPITKNTTEKLFLVMGIPIKRGKEMTQIIISSQYLLQKDKNKLVSFKNKDLLNCKTNNKKIKICPFFKRTEEHTCEIDLFLKNNQTTCKYIKMIPQSYLIKISDNTFHLSTFNKTKYEISCLNISEINYTKRNAIFTLNPGCKIKTNNEQYTVPYEENLENTELLFPNITNKDFRVEEAYFNKPINLNNIFTEDFSKYFQLMTNKTNHLMDSTKDPIKRIKTKDYSDGYIAITLWLIAMLLLLIRVCCVGPN